MAQGCQAPVSLRLEGKLHMSVRRLTDMKDPQCQSVARAAETRLEWMMMQDSLSCRPGSHYNTTIDNEERGIMDGFSFPRGAVVTRS